MILTRKRLPVDIFLTDCLSKSLAFYEFPSINFSPGKENYTWRTTSNHAERTGYTVVAYILENKTGTQM